MDNILQRLSFAGGYLEFLFKMDVLSVEAIAERIAEFDVFITEPFPQPLRLLHVGCEGGELLTYVGKELPCELLVGFGTPQDMVKVVELAEQHEVQLDYVFNGSDFRYPDGSFNCVLISDLRVVSNEGWEDLIRQSARLLTEGGLYILRHQTRTTDETTLDMTGAAQLLLTEGVSVSFPDCLPTRAEMIWRGRKNAHRSFLTSEVLGL